MDQLKPEGKIYFAGIIEYNRDKSNDPTPTDLTCYLLDLETGEAIFHSSQPQKLGFLAARVRGIDGLTTNITYDPSKIPAQFRGRRPETDVEGVERRHYQWDIMHQREFERGFNLDRAKRV